MSLFSLNKDDETSQTLPVNRHFENTKFLAGNDHVMDIFTSEHIVKIYYCAFLVSYNEMSTT